MADHLNTIWKEICSKVKEQVSADTFRRWFSSTQLVEADESRLLVRVPNHIYGLWIDSNYIAILNHAVVGVLGEARKVDWQPLGSLENEAHAEPLLDTCEDLEVKVAARQQKTPERVKVATPHPLTSIEKSIKRAGLNRNYRFDAFVVGSNNEYAAAAARAR